MRARRVLRLRSRISEALFFPLTFQPVCSRVWSICRLSMASSVSRAEEVADAFFRSSSASCSLAPGELITARSRTFFQFPDIAGPGVSLQHFNDGLGNHGNNSAHSFADFLDEEIGKHGNVVKAVTQRRNGDRKNVQAVPEILADPPVRTVIFQVAIGGGKNSGIHFYGPELPRRSNSPT